LATKEQAEVPAGTQFAQSRIPRGVQFKPGIGQPQKRPHSHLAATWRSYLQSLPRFSPCGNSRPAIRQSVHIKNDSVDEVSVSFIIFRPPIREFLMEMVQQADVNIADNLQHVTI